MGLKSSQLQIRVTPEQKAALKRLAAQRGASVSEYVLGVCLPSSQDEFARLADSVVAAPRRAKALDALTGFLSALDGPEALRVASAAYEPSGASLAGRNCVAAAVEEAAELHGTEIPGWVRAARPPEKPYFDWALGSLRPHLMRITPAVYKRRNVFIDAARVEAPKARRRGHHDSGSPSGGRPHATLPGARRPLDEDLEALSAELVRRELLLELCVVAGAVIPLPFSANPPTRAVGALFRSSEEAAEALGEVRAARDLGPEWPATPARAVVSGENGSEWAERPQLRVFEAPAQYVLAMKCAALDLSAGPADLEDVRFLLRMANTTDPEAPLDAVQRYFSKRQLPSGLKSVLAGLLA